MKTPTKQNILKEKITEVQRLCGKCYEEDGKITPTIDKSGKVHIHNIRETEGYQLAQKETAEKVKRLKEEFERNDWENKTLDVAKNRNKIIDKIFKEKNGS